MQKNNLVEENVPAGGDTGWLPILSSPLLGLARDAVDRIASELCPRIAPDLPPTNLIERALLCAYLSRVEKGGGWSSRTIEYLNAAGERLSTGQKLGLGLFGGLSGFGWIVEHINNLLDITPIDLDCQGEDPIEEVDNKFISYLRRSSPTDPLPYDLVSGLVGIGIYFLERLPRPSASLGIRLILDLLEQQSEIPRWGAKIGVTWYRRTAFLPLNHAKFYPKGYYDLGVAHGVPGIIPFLADVVKTDIESKQALRLLEGAVRWIRAQRRAPHELSLYSSILTHEGNSTDSRLAWCYGDLGIAAALHHAAGSVGRQDWHEEAITLLNRSLEWPKARDQIEDASLCHGALGVGHICNRIYQTDLDSRYRDAANLWYERGLAFRHQGLGVAGFYPKPKNTLSEPGFDSSFLSGAIGIALSLLSSMFPVEPEWDRMFLLSRRASFQRHARIRE